MKELCSQDHPPFILKKNNKYQILTFAPPRRMLYAKAKKNINKTTNTGIIFLKHEV